MAVFRELKIVWRGKDYFVTPSMKLMRSIEMGDISLTDIAIRTSQGKPPISHMAFVLHRMLSAAGAVSTEDEVYEELINGDQEAVGQLIGLALKAFTPEAREVKNQDAQA
jgi:hypothetical protein